VSTFTGQGQKVKPAKAVSICDTADIQPGAFGSVISEGLPEDRPRTTALGGLLASDTRSEQQSIMEAKKGQAYE